MPGVEFWDAAGKYGIGIVIAIIVVVAVWKFFTKSLWPRLTKQLDDAEARLKEQGEKAQQRYDEQSKAFLVSLFEQRRDFLASITIQQELQRTQQTLQEHLFEEQRELMHSQQLVMHSIAETLGRVDDQTRPPRKK